MTTREVIAMILSGGAIGALGKTIFDYIRNRKKDAAEAKKLLAETGRTFAEQSKVFAEAEFIRIQGKAMAEEIWRVYALKVEANLEEQKKIHHTIKRELQQCRIDFRKMQKSLQEQIDKLNKN